MSAFKLHELAVEALGDPAPLYALVAACEGPGFVDWPDIDPLAQREYLEARLISDRTPVEVARRVAYDVLSIARDRQDRARSEAERNPARQPLDLNRIVPIPPAIVRAGCVPDGRAWMRDNWGCEAPLGRVDLQVQQRIRRNRGRPSPKNKGNWSITTASYRWWSDGTPTAALRRLVVRWPTLDFRLTIDGRPKRLTEAPGHAKRRAV